MATATKRVPVEEIDGFEFLGGVFLEIEEAFHRADYSEPLKPMLEMLEQTHAAGFESESTPGGEKWPPLAASTVAKKGHDVILLETGRLKASLANKTGDSVREVSHRGLLFGTQVEYAGIHQNGTSRIPQREHVGMNEETAQRIVDVVADATVEALKYTV
jgi:phage gpG-like protein